MAIDTSTRSIQVKEHLLDYIDKNHLGQGDQLPSEAEMAKNLGVSRNTIREAYISLEAEGTIIRKHGIGTFVSRPSKIKESLLDDLLGFPHYITSAGYKHDYKVVSIERVFPTAEVCRVLQVSPNEKVLQFKYVQFADGTPAIYLIDHFSHLIDEAEVDWDHFEGDMLPFVTEALNMPERHFYSRIMAAIVDDEIATYLDLPVGMPIINVKSTVTSMEGQPVTYSVIYLNPENIEFDLTRIYRQK